MSTDRYYISVYFPDGKTSDRNKRDLTISIGKRDEIYDECKNLGSEEIKEIAGVSSYRDLAFKARAEGRTLGNFIKHRLVKALSNHE